MLRDPQLDLADDVELGLTHEVERAPDRAFGRILDRDHRMIRLSGLCGAKYFVDRCVGFGLDELAEVSSDGAMAERAGRP